MTTKKIAYVTSSQFKKNENAVFMAKAHLIDGTPVSSIVSFDLTELSLKEILEVDISVMVQAEVVAAYSQIRVPCIVEHAGLVFDDYQADSYPGGLTKPMWNALGTRFLDEMKAAGRRASAKAVVAYCDGMTTKTFVGETKGTLADRPRGSREFYWDTIFIPDDPSGKSAGRTYAEIVDEPTLGLEYKVAKLSQSTKAMLKFVEHLRNAGDSGFWP
jgi:inosine/xanthosine triphosphate pyrophosphatase family protein